ncbi:MAG: transglycosylase domain-containing protein, partial [Gemmatimonadetes bacterium]|nr:transglycosylase domain-containing protein [Gemmatimonadota bacterium]
MRRALLIGAVLTVLFVLATGLGVGYAIWRMTPNLPSLPTDHRELGIRPGTEMYAASGERIYTFNQSRQWVRLEDISPHVVQALIATEDAHFYHHRGVDLLAIGGAVRDNLRRGSLTRGGSTLTQQLVKRLFFSPQKTFERKLSEALLAVQLEAFFAASYSDTNAAGHPVYKNRLLELYLNEVFYGTNAYGIYDAAITFFDTTP